jgi:hypothetical protein
MLPALVDKGEYGYNVDDVSGYFYVHLTERSQEFFGFEWDGIYYVYTALNFGWKSAPYVYTCFSGGVAGFLRRLGLRYLLVLARRYVRDGDIPPEHPHGAARAVRLGRRGGLCRS